MNHDSLHVIDHPLVQHKLHPDADARNHHRSFQAASAQNQPGAGFEVTRDLPTTKVRILTPLAEMSSPVISGKKLCVASILRAGNGMLDGVLDFLPAARVGHIGLYRDPQTLEAVEYYFKVPEDISEHLVVVVDPMLATGHSAIAAIDRLKTAGATSIRFVCLLAAPEGVEALHKAHPDVDITAAALDECLNDHGYIMPGLGDAGDHMFGTR